MASRTKVVIEVDGEPLSKSNAHQVAFRRSASGKACRFIYVPKKIRDYESKVKEAAKKVMAKLQMRAIKKLVRLTVVYYYGTKRVKDLTNLPKTTCDALNKVVYKDDSQIHEAHLIRKLDRKRPRVKIIVEIMEDEEWEEG